MNAIKTLFEINLKSDTWKLKHDPELRNKPFAFICIDKSGMRYVIRRFKSYEKAIDYMTEQLKPIVNNYTREIKEGIFEV